jgi:hypothetical protein
MRANTTRGRRLALIATDGCGPAVRQDLVEHGAAAGLQDNRRRRRTPSAIGRSLRIDQFPKTSSTTKRGRTRSADTRAIWLRARRSQVGASCHLTATDYMPSAV